MWDLQGLVQSPRQRPAALTSTEQGCSSTWRALASSPPRATPWVPSPLGAVRACRASLGAAAPPGPFCSPSLHFPLSKPPFSVERLSKEPWGLSGQEACTRHSVCDDNTETGCGRMGRPGHTCCDGCFLLRVFLWLSQVSAGANMSWVWPRTRHRQVGGQSRSKAGIGLGGSSSGPWLHWAGAPSLGGPAPIPTAQCSTGRLCASPLCHPQLHPWGTQDATHVPWS